MSPNKEEWPMGERKEVIVESEVEYKVNCTQRHEANPQEGTTKEPKKIIESKEDHVSELKKKVPIPTVVVYRHQHHIEKQKSLRKGREHQHTYYEPT